MTCLMIAAELNIIVVAVWNHLHKIFVRQGTLLAERFFRTYQSECNLVDIFMSIKLSECLVSITLLFTRP